MSFLRHTRQNCCTHGCTTEVNFRINSCPSISHAPVAALPTCMPMAPASKQEGGASAHGGKVLGARMLPTVVTPHCHMPFQCSVPCCTASCCSLASSVLRYFSFLRLLLLLISPVVAPGPDCGRLPFPCRLLHATSAVYYAASCVADRENKHPSMRQHHVCQMLASVDM